MYTEESIDGLVFGKFRVSPDGYLYVPLEHLPEHRGKGRFLPVETYGSALATPNIKNLMERAARRAFLKEG